MLRKALTFVLCAVLLSACNGSSSGQNRIDQGGLVGDTPLQGTTSTLAAAPQSQPAAAQAAEKAQSPADQQVVEKVPGLEAAAAATSTSPLPSPTPSQANTPTKASAAANPAPAVASQPLGPDHFPAGINPLTGLPVKDPANLNLAPALVSVTNFPTTARPQAGLSFSPFVYEMYIGEGMTRFLAILYGDYPQKAASANAGANSGLALSDDRIGPIRSGRLPYESLRKLYNGFLVMASGSSVVLPSLSQYTNVFGSDTGDINSALIPATKLEEIAKQNDKRLAKDALTGLYFDQNVPAGGKTGKMLWIPFNFLDQVIWRYDASSGAYLRYQDDADGKTFIQASDRLNKQPLQYNNVVILFANHQARRETLINIDLLYINKMPALLFRDGKMYEIYWTTANGDYEKTTGLVRPIRFIDAQGNPFPLKPGQTWVEIVQQFTQYNETVDSTKYMELKTKTQPGSGNWAIHFYPTIPERK
jgi:hypothetical protein